MANKKQIMLIHGGMTFRRRSDYLQWLRTREVKLEKSRKWSRQYLDRRLGKDFDIIRPSMPLADNAHYDAWCIHFERLVPFLRDYLILIGVSLGGVFLARYLAENKFPKKLRSVFLVAPPYDNTLSDEDLTNGFRLPTELSLLEKNTKHLHLLFSADDDVVPAEHAEKYRKKLPGADIIIYKSKNGHFQVPTFPEIVKMIKADAGVK